MNSSVRWLMVRTAVSLLCASAAWTQVVGEEVPAWSPGTLDIHQINTAAGDCTFLILPDGTSMLVDAGATPPTNEFQVPLRPNDSRPPGEWIARYVRHMLAHDASPLVDYGFLTHFHGDHMGALPPDSEMSKSGEYKLSGITRVGELIPIRRMLDRGWPDYNWPRPLASPTMKNYRAFLRWQVENNGMQVEQFEPGRNDQIVLLRAAAKYPNFEVRNIVANAEVWTGVGTNTRKLYPSTEGRGLPSENNTSMAIRLSYGAFDYYTGGDLTGVHDSGPPWQDVETPVAKAVGPVDVAVPNHHGYLDSTNAFFVSTLRPRVWVIPVRDAAHPGHRVYRRMLSESLYPGPRDVFGTNINKATSLVAD